MVIAFNHIIDLMQEKLEEEKYQIIDAYVDACKVIDGEVKGAEELGMQYFEKKYFSNQIF